MMGLRLETAYNAAMEARETLSARRRVLRAVPVALVLAVHLVLLLDAARQDSITFDEPAYVAGGLDSLLSGDYRLEPDSGTLPQRVQALPLAIAGVRMPVDEEAYRISDGYAFGRLLFYESGHDTSRLLFLARLPTIALSVVLAWFVFHVATRLMGSGAGWIALIVFAFNPLALAHGHLATSDTAFALAFMASSWLLWWCLHRVTPARLLVSGVVAGAAFLTKMSAVLLIPVGLIFVIVRMASRHPVRIDPGVARRFARWWPTRDVAGVRRLLPLAGIGIAHALMVALMLWAACGFRYQAALTPDAVLPDGGWETLRVDTLPSRAVDVAREHRLLPEAWLFGLKYHLEHASERRAFAMGKYSMTGWWWYFPASVLLKTPLSALALLLLAAIAFPAAWRRGRRVLVEARSASPDDPPWSAAARDLVAATPVLVPVVVMAFVASTASLNIGLRHLLPAFPGACVLAGAAWGFVSARPIVRVGVLALALGVVGEGVLAHPLHVAHMNPLAGPERLRWRRLTDSSLDWGQDAGRVRAFLRAEQRGGERPSYIAWFGSSDPIREGAVAESLPGYPDLTPGTRELPLHGGTYVVSATVLVQTYSNFPGPWAQPYEELWRRAEGLARPYLDADDIGRAVLRERHGDDYWDRLLESHDQLRLARLCSFLRVRRPDTVIGGGAVLVHRLGEADVWNALLGAPVELVAEPVLPWAGSRQPAPSAPVGP